MKKILIIDDSITIAETIRVIVNDWGIQADTAPSGVEAMELVKTNYYDMVLLDIMMPRMDGNKTLWHFEREKTMLTDSTPIVAMSSNDYNGARDEYISRGFTDYLAKPICIEDVRNLMTKYNILT